jgi:hypothetical protein
MTVPGGAAMWGPRDSQKVWRIGSDMTYLVLRSDDQLPMKYETMGGAINAACHLISTGAAVAGIKGLNGFSMERNDIQIECARRKAETSSNIPGS